MNGARDGAGPRGIELVQARAILRLELRRAFLSRRALFVYLLAFLPVFVCALPALGTLWGFTSGDARELGTLTKFYAGVYEGLLLRLAIFLGCAWVFTNLFRGEILDRTLHYYLLAPVRRELLVGAKYAAGLITTATVFGVSVAACMILALVPAGRAAAIEYLLEGPGLAHLGAYVWVAVLACTAYGALFLVLGLFLRNPGIPGLIVFGWESLTPFFPPLLKRVSVVHYLRALLPIELDEGPFAILGEPPAAWVALVCLMLLAVASLSVAAVGMRRFELSYGAE